MRIGVDATSWPNGRGYGRYTRALVTAALELDRRNQYVLFVDHESSDFPLPPSAEVRRISTSAPTIEAAGANSRRSLGDLWAVACAVREARVDLIYFPTDYTYVPLYMGVPRIVTVHDAIAETFPELVFPTLRSKIFYRAKIKSGIRQARLVATVSEYSRRQLIEKLRIAPERIRVVGEAADPIFRRMEGSGSERAAARRGIPAEARFLIYVGGFSPHKNLFMLLDVFRELAGRAAHGDLRLLLVGDYSGDSFHSCYAQLVERVRAERLEGKIVFTGRVEDQELALLLNRAEALVLPSFSEGFGLPGIEAAACGAPVIATTESPLPELLGEGALAADPRDRGAWLRAIERVLSDDALRTHMSQAALAAAARVSWESAARQLLSVFDEVEQAHGAPA